MEKTVGKFVITSKFDENFKYEGYSKQCEVMFRDYMGWCIKGKAPKLLQAEYDKHPDLAGKPGEIFDLTVQPLSTEEFEKITNKRVAQAPTAPKDFVPPTIDQMMENNSVGGEQADPEDDTDWKTLYDEYASGTSVKEICEREHISQNKFYKNIEQFK